ncbi:SDR family NAD(P)-dependent oxidoreductase [Streptomyces sp. NPDC057963]|uniref:SDR family NAD(P)-dependent oxidoreductase n=1 Tax=Streptomyces sp. NPDC057963 TaxID=3346290 RepID=UPI0036EFC181
MTYPEPSSEHTPGCLVIGATGAIGGAVAQHLRNAGTRVTATGRTVPNVAADDPAAYRGVELDVRDPEAIARTVDEAAAWMGGLDALVYCPGVAHVGPLEDLAPGQWDEIFEVNVRGFGLAVAAALPHWRAGKGGVAVAISSQAGQRGQSLISAYSASKAALDGMVRALAVELAPTVRVNAVAPGIVASDMIADDFRRQADRESCSEDEIEARTLRRIPVGRFQTRESIAAVVAMLVTGEAAADITGQTLVVDGGMTA